MSEQLIREGLAEKDRLRDRLEDQNRTASLEKSHAVLVTRFDAWIERAVQGEDLKELKREWESALRDTNINIREHFFAANEQQSTNILGQVQTMLANERVAAAEDQKNLRRQIFIALFTWGLGILGALFVFWLTTRGG